MEPNYYVEEVDSDASDSVEGSVRSNQEVYSRSHGVEEQSDARVRETRNLKWELA